LLYRKQHYEKNSEKVIEVFKIYNDKDKDKLRQKILCDCGRKICVGAKTLHFKSQIHKRYLESLQPL
jgi:hypothetical protein